jgi:hypothetical protein
MFTVLDVGTKLPQVQNSSMIYLSFRFLVFLEHLISGDIVSITRPTDDITIPCDLLLLRGNCVVDEGFPVFLLTYNFIMKI